MNNMVTGIFVGWLSLAILIMSYRWLSRWWQDRRYGPPIDHSVLLSEYGRKLTDVEDQLALVKLLTETIPQVLNVSRAALLLPNGHKLVELKSDGLVLAISHSAVRWVASAGEAQSIEHKQLQNFIRQNRTDDLNWTQIWVPLMRGTGLCGVWFLGARDNKLRFSAEDKRWLTAIAREAAAVLETIQYTERERLTASEMRTLYRQMVNARERERGILARELHDGVLQDLCAVTRDLKAIETQEGFNDLPFSNLSKLSGDTVSSLRAICTDLRPPLLQNDFESALKALVSEMDGRSQAPVHLEIEAKINELYLSDEAALAIFRISQEALNNALQHANASEIAVRLIQYPDRLRLTITDDGRGISGPTDSADFVAQGHYGVAGMRERAAMIGGRLDVQTAIDYGTVVIFTLAIPNDFSSR